MTAPSKTPPPANPPPMRLLFWELTARCNLACVHCRRLSPESADNAHELTTAQGRLMLDSAAMLGRPIIVFSGGEPLMRDDWETLARYARSINLPTALATNGTLIDAITARRIAGAGFRRVAVSIDGADSSTHDALRGHDGAFAKAIAGIDRLREQGVRVQINSTVTGQNVEQLERILTLAGDLGAEALHLFLLVPVGCGVELAETSQLSPQRYEQALNWICDRQADPSTNPRKLELKATCAPHYARIAIERNLPPGGGCLCGTAVAFVSHTGQVFPCGYLPVNCGSVISQSLADIWRESKVFAELRNRDLLGGKCGDCNYRVPCGGCRARAYAATGDYLSAEPACSYQPR